MLFVVLAQQILTVIVAVRYAHHGMNMLPNRDIRTRIGQRDGTLMVELNDDNRALNPEEKQVIRAKRRIPLIPAEISLVHVRHDLFHPVPGMHLAVDEKELLDQLDHEIPAAQQTDLRRESPGTG